MKESDKTIVELIITGGLIGIAKLMVGHEPLSFRLVVGRAVLGSATSMAAGAALLRIPELPPIGLLGLGSLIGIVGAQYLEALLRTKAKQFFGEGNGK